MGAVSRLDRAFGCAHGLATLGTTRTHPYQSFSTSLSGVRGSPANADLARTLAAHHRQLLPGSGWICDRRNVGICTRNRERMLAIQRVDV